MQGKSSEMNPPMTTRLGRAVRNVDRTTKTPMIGKEKHSTNTSLRDVILGGQDGLVNMLGIALGVVAAGGSTHVLVVTGIAAAITESISMGAVAYTSFGTDATSISPRWLASRMRSQQDQMTSARKLERSMRRRASRGSCSRMLFPRSLQIVKPG